MAFDKNAYKEITVYQDKDPLGKGEWFAYVAQNGHIIANLGGYTTEEQAREAAAKV